jgi:hypothetical protein
LTAINSASSKHHDTQVTQVAWQATGVCRSLLQGLHPITSKAPAPEARIKSDGGWRPRTTVQVPRLLPPFPMAAHSRSSTASFSKEPAGQAYCRRTTILTTSLTKKRCSHCEESISLGLDTAMFSHRVAAAQTGTNSFHRTETACLFYVWHTCVHCCITTHSKSKIVPIY